MTMLMLFFLQILVGEPQSNRVAIGSSKEDRVLPKKDERAEGMMHGLESLL